MGWLAAPLLTQGLYIMIKLEKNGGIKILSPESNLIERLLADGWVKVDGRRKVNKEEDNKEEQSEK